MLKTLEILKYFPSFHQAMEREKLLYHVADSIALRIQEMENDMTEVMKSHWIKTAENIYDLEKIAALYGIEREEFEDIKLFRKKVEDVIRLYLAGPCTVPAVIEFITIALRKYGVQAERDENGSLVIIHPVESDESRAKCRIYFDGVESHIEIYENPIIEKSYKDSTVTNHQKWFLENKGFFFSVPEVTFQGYDKRTINPVLFNRSTGHALGFRGVLPEGCMLKIKVNDQGFLDTAQLDGKNVKEDEKDVKSRIFSLQGSQFDRCKFDENNSNFASYLPSWAFNEIRFAESVRGESNPPVFDIPIPIIPASESEWEFKIKKSNYNNSRFDETAFTFPDEPTGVFDGACFDKSLFMIDCSAGLEMKWMEHQRATFEVILPNSLSGKQINSTDVEEQKKQYMEPLQGVSKMMERVKPAGVNVIVKYSSEDSSIN